MGEGAGVLVVSNRGPVSFYRDDDGKLRSRRGGGGLVSSLGPLVREADAIWVSAALSAHDRAAVAEGVAEAEGIRLRSLVIDPALYAAAYDTIANSTLWFLHHGLFDLAREPCFDRAWTQAWDAYREVNRRFAAAVIEEADADATVLIQDYHLALVGQMVADQRDDLRCVHFTHIPFCTPEELSILPAAVAVELLQGMAANSACGFHAQRWTESFKACCRSVLGRDPVTFTAPIAADGIGLNRVADSAAGSIAASWLESQVGRLRVAVRVERIEPSKNALRGLAAFDELLERRPDLRGEVMMAAFVYPSRESLESYRTYRRDLEHKAAAVNARWGADGWEPVLLDSSDDFARSVAGLVRYDVLMVNPVRDGLNLIAKEGPLLNRRNGVLVLSTEAGVSQELGSAPLRVNPFDISATASALAQAFDMTAEERLAHADALRADVAAGPPQAWLDAQLKAAEPQ